MSPDVRIDHGRMLDLLASEGQLLTAATHDARGDFAVPGVSGRTLGETVRYLGDLCEDTLSWMGATEAAARNWVFPDDAGLREVTGRFTARLADLLAEFAMRPPDESCATWWPEEHSTSFWLRRMVHATTMGRVDVQTSASVELTPIDAGAAVDGIDEVLRVWLEYRLHALGIKGVRSCSVDVRAADQCWRVSTDPQRTTVTPVGSGAQAASATLGGDAWAVYLWLWGRLPDRAVEVDGDPDAIAQLWGLLRLATQ